MDSLTLKWTFVFDGFGVFRIGYMIYLGTLPTYYDLGPDYSRLSPYFLSRRVGVGKQYSHRTGLGRRLFS